MPAPAVDAFPWLLRLVALACGGVYFGWIIFRQGTQSFQEARIPLTKTYYLTGLVARICSLPMIFLGLLCITSGIGLAAFFVFGTIRAWGMR